MIMDRQDPNRVFNKWFIYRSYYVSTKLFFLYPSQTLVEHTDNFFFFSLFVPHLRDATTRHRDYA